MTFQTPREHSPLSRQWSEPMGGARHVRNPRCKIDERKDGDKQFPSTRGGRTPTEATRRRVVAALWGVGWTEGIAMCADNGEEGEQRSSEAVRA